MFEIRALPLRNPPDGDKYWRLIQFYVGAQNLSAHIDDEGEMQIGVSWPARRLALWFARVTELRDPEMFTPVAELLRHFALRLRAEGEEELDLVDTFVRNHALQAATHGARLPNLWFHWGKDVVTIEQGAPTPGFPELKEPVQIPRALWEEQINKFVEAVGGAP